MKRTGLIIVTALLSASIIQAEPTQATTVLVLADGRNMLVQSYEVAGPVVKIVGPKGEPLIYRTTKIDLEASEKKTAAYQAQLDREAEKAEKAEQEAAEQAERKAQAKAARDARNAQLRKDHIENGVSSMSTAPVKRIGPPKATAGKPSTSSSGTVTASIKARCESKWPGNYRMQKYCMEQQAASGAKVKRYTDAATARSDQDVIGACGQKWKDEHGYNWRMVAYCIEQQLTAKRSMGQ